MNSLVKKVNGMKVYGRKYPGICMYDKMCHKVPQTVGQVCGGVVWSKMRKVSSTVHAVPRQEVLLQVQQRVRQGGRQTLSQSAENQPADNRVIDV